MAWAFSITAFTLLRYLDIPGGVPWARTVTGIAIAVGVQMVMGTVFWIYDGRYRVGSRDEAVAVAKSFIATFLILRAGQPPVRRWSTAGPVDPHRRRPRCARPGGGARLVWRSLHESMVRPEGAAPALVLGVGSAGIQLVAQHAQRP